MRRRRVLQVCHNHPEIRPGGAEAYAYELHRALRAAPGWEPVFLARSGPPHASDARPHRDTPLAPRGGRGDEYLVFPDEYDFDWLMGTMRRDKGLVTQHLRPFLQGLRPDVVHVQHTLFLGYDVIAEVRRALPGAAIVHTLHEFLPICHAKGQMVRTMDASLCTHASPRRCHECFPEVSPQAFFLRERFVKAHLDAVDLFVVPSDLLRRRYLAWGLPGDRILLEDYGRLPPTEPPAPRPAPHRVLGFFGQLNPYKGIVTLLEAMRGLGDGVRLRVHGANLDLQDRPFRDRVAELLQQTADAVELAGPYAPGDVGRLMAGVDWVVVPSTWWENSPLVIQEAFAHGRPVLCSDIGGMAEKVADGLNGLHFRAGDPDDLRATILRAVRTPGLWERLRDGIPAVHTMQAHAEVLTRAYADLLDRRASERAA